jgi:hypothetical protein
VSDDGPPTENLHIAFQTDGEEAVRRFYEAALAAGGRDNGAPGTARGQLAVGLSADGPLSRVVL